MRRLCQAVTALVIKKHGTTAGTDAVWLAQQKSPVCGQGMLSIHLY